MQTVNPFAIVTDDATSLDEVAYAMATELLCAPAHHPDQFRFLLSVRLPEHFRPVPCVASVVVDERNAVAIDEVWIFWPGFDPERTRRGDDFNKVRLTAVFDHYGEILEQAALHRAAPVSLPDPAPLQPFGSALLARHAVFGEHRAA